MIDLHAHILPGLDHGPRDWDESLAMCRIAVEDGIRTIAATPHVSEEFPNRRERVEECAGELRRRLAAAGIPLEILTGGDHHAHPGLGPGNVLTLGGNGRYFLLEFPYATLPPRADAFVHGLLANGLTPIVTHPERIAALQREWWPLEPLSPTHGMTEGSLGDVLRNSLNIIVLHGNVDTISDARNDSVMPRVPRIGQHGPAIGTAALVAKIVDDEGRP